MKPATHPSALRVQAVLGDDFTVVEFDVSTRTAQEAAAAIGCAVSEIAKTLVFRAERGGFAVVVVASGTNRVDEKKLAALVGEPIGRAAPDFVRESTGFAIGGVPPIGLVAGTSLFIDQDLMAFPSVWAAAGTPNAVFNITPQDLEMLSRGTIADIAAR